MSVISKADLDHILKHTHHLWSGVEGKNFFITGGTGFFGKWLLESFLYINSELGLNNNITVLTRDSKAFLKKYPHFSAHHIDFIKGDIRTFKFPAGTVDYIIHAATEASASLNMEQPLLMYETIVEGTKRILELARIKNTTSVLHTSSGAVYGKQPYSLTHIGEEYTGSPDIYGSDAAYGEGKRVAEMLSNLYFNSYGVPSKIARCFAFVGPHLPLNGNFAIGNFIRDILNGNDIIIKGDGTPFRSYLYASDLAIWLWTILLKGKNCRPYNVGSGQDLTIEDTANLVAACSDKEVRIDIIQKERSQFPQRYVPAVSRAAEELGLVPLIDLKSAIQKTINFYGRQNNIGK